MKKVLLSLLHYLESVVDLFKKKVVRFKNIINILKFINEFGKNCCKQTKILDTERRREFKSFHQLVNT